VRELKKYFLYKRSFADAIQKYHKTSNIKLKRDYIKKSAFYGVKSVVSQRRQTLNFKEDYEAQFHFIELVNLIIGLLTPNEFMNIFPIEKDYDGHKWGSKDYFYTKKYINTLNRNEPIGSEENVMKFLWEYHNWETKEFTVATMMCISGLRRFQGLPSLAEEWAAENNIKTYNMHTDDKGNQFLLDGETGRTIKVEKPKPRRPKHFKVIK
jgi:hypothetical protein